MTRYHCVLTTGALDERTFRVLTEGDQTCDSMSLAVQAFTSPPTTERICMYCSSFDHHLEVADYYIQKNMDGTLS